MWILFLFIIVIVGLCVLLLGIRIFFVKDGKFPNTHIEGNRLLKDKGIHCANAQDRDRTQKQRTKTDSGHKPE